MDRWTAISQVYKEQSPTLATLPTPTNTKTQTMPSTETYNMWVFFVSDMQNLINGPNVKVILVGWVKLNGQKMLLLVGQAHLLSEINILCEWGKT